MTDSGADASLAVQRRRESRREEWTEQTALTALLAEFLDPSCTFNADAPAGVIWPSEPDSSQRIEDPREHA